MAASISPSNLSTADNAEGAGKGSDGLHNKKQKVNSRMHKHMPEIATYPYRMSEANGSGRFVLDSTRDEWYTCKRSNLHMYT